MITKIGINAVATFKEQQYLEGLRKFNYFFGSNGSGKTTISRVIDKPDDFTSCSIFWENQNQLEKRVYNRDFVARNFNQQKLSGIFTLGEATQETIDAIATTKKDLDDLQNEIGALKNTLNGADGNGGKVAELEQHTKLYKEKFFKMKQKYADKLSGNQTGDGMRGFIKSQDIFMKKVLSEKTSNAAELLALEELEKKAKAIFSNNNTRVDLLSEISTTEILQHEKNSILQKRIIGKDDVDIAAMIKKLNNSDWVRQGLPFYEANDGVCPFCQQKTNESFHKDISDYFDEAFTKDSNNVKTLIDDYSTGASRIQNQIQSLIDANSPFLDIENLKQEKQLLDSNIAINNQRLIEKQKEGSKVVSLVPLENVLTKITSIITAGNAKIIENNHIADNLQSEKLTLTSQIWKFVISELDTDITEYNNGKIVFDNAINSINTKITSKTAEKTRIETKLHELEKQITSIIPTKDGINRLLDIFGFKSFKLDLGDEPNTYKLVREDGSDANHTLSEGERNFLTFLYFYHLLKGSQVETGIAVDKIVVIDDPISSLDNNVLFIVSTLIRELIQDVRDNNGSIKQIFILTHNIYFHKEVSFNQNRRKGVLSEETFWLIKKNGKVSTVEKQTENPIKTSYELLWDEVRKDSRNNATIQNTLRRILENYFKLLGHTPLDKLYEKFTGEDKVKCKALCSWVHDGSHSVFDEDFYTPLDDTMIQEFLTVFRQIFQETDHISHYNMMMGIISEEKTAV